MKKTFLILSIFVLSGCGYFDCYVEDHIENYRVERCTRVNGKTINELYFNHKKLGGTSVNSLKEVKYTHKYEYIYVHSKAFDEIYTKESFDPTVGYSQGIVNKELQKLPIGHPSRATQYTKINNENGDTWYFQKKEQMDKQDKNIFEKLAKINELEKEGKWERKNNYHNEWNWFKQKWRNWWDGTYKYPPERVDYEELFDI